MVIPQSSVKSIIEKWREYGTCVNLPRAGSPHKLIDCARNRLVREAPRTPMTPYILEPLTDLWQGSILPFENFRTALDNLTLNM